MQGSENVEIRKRTGTIGIVTVTFNSGSVLADFISSLEGQSYSDFLVWAVDNASKDDTIPLLQAWKDPRLIIIANETNVGVAAVPPWLKAATTFFCLITTYSSVLISYKDC